MRKRIQLIGLGALIAAVATTGVAFGITATQTLDVKVAPSKKLSKKKFKKGSIDVTTTTSDAEDPSGMPPKANRAVIRFDDDLKFTTKRVGRCTQAKLEGTTTAQAIDKCRSAKVGKGNAVAALPFGMGGARADFPAKVTAFNGRPQGRKPVIYLHSYLANPLPTTTILTGVLKNDRGDFGKKLDVSIPLLAGGAGAIAEFQVKVKRGGYVKVRCRDRNKTWNFKSTFTYNDADPKRANDKQRCKVRR